MPRRNLVPKPAGARASSEAACLPTACLTAYRMLFTRARLQPGQTVLVQGAGGGVASAAIALARAAGARASGRPAASEDKRELRRSSSAPTRPSRPAPACPSASTP